MSNSQPGATEDVNRSDGPYSETDSHSRPAGREGVSEPPPCTSNAAQEMSLRQIQQDFEDNRQRMHRRLDRLQTQDSAVFRVMLVSGAISIVLILWGAYYFFFNGVGVVAVLSELVGLLSGVGTTILRRLQKDLRDKANRLERQEEEQTRYLRAIQSALALTGSNRDRQLAETAKWLREGAAKRSPQQPAVGDAKED
ncbi:MAG: hypothetical protein GY797_08790 [Deltaproteobacteria bacterium]|nr:hypothetical protein [Deltaproteobacteria bacterium]